LESEKSGLREGEGFAECGHSSTVQQRLNALGKHFGGSMLGRAIQVSSGANPALPPFVSIDVTLSAVDPGRKLARAHLDQAIRP
jgi:hypothetical protein